MREKRSRCKQNRILIQAIFFLSVFNKEVVQYSVVHIILHQGLIPDAGKGSAVCSCSALWDPLPCSSPSTADCLGAPFGRGTFPGGQVRFLGDFGVLVYPPSGVARQSHCTPALLSILMSLGHCTDHCSTRSGSRAPEKKKKKKTYN